MMIVFKLYYSNFGIFINNNRVLVHKEHLKFKLTKGGQTEHAWGITSVCCPYREKTETAFSQLTDPVAPILSLFAPYPQR